MTSYADRRSAAGAALPDDVDALLVSLVVNVRYLTGFTGSNAALLVRPDGSATFATDGRYLTQAAEEVPDLECVDARSSAAALVGRAAADGAHRLGIERSAVTLAEAEQFRAAADGRLDLVETESVVERLRAVKDEAEIEHLQRACAITDAAFAAVLGRLRPGVTEREIAWFLHGCMRENGADGLAFDTIVAFGSHSAIPHHRPTDRALEAGDLVKLDFGARSGGYHADMTRTVVVGPAADWQRELHASVQAIQAECRAAAVAGASPRELDGLARSGIEAAGSHAAHGLGHGVGLEVHELPFLSASSHDTPLVDRTAVTIEPGIYLPGRGGVRIEDSIVIDGAAPRSLTASDRSLLEC
ncbi:MAG TPA: Xaa-Pro peptidase family protein [Mycobacteriales bacterium]|nr:Xaa-Pro peptidase family protein [Mycobacteriales bacterium]